MEYNRITTSLRTAARPCATVLVQVVVVVVLRTCGIIIIVIFIITRAGLIFRNATSWFFLLFLLDN